MIEIRQRLIWRLLIGLLEIRRLLIRLLNIWGLLWRNLIGVAIRVHLRRNARDRPRLGVIILLDIHLLRLSLHWLLGWLLAVLLIDGPLEDFVCFLIFRERREEFLAAEEIDDHDEELDDEIEHAENRHKGDANGDDGAKQSPQNPQTKFLQPVYHMAIF